MTEETAPVKCPCMDKCSCEGICPCVDCIPVLNKETAELFEEFSHREKGVQ